VNTIANSHVPTEFVSLMSPCMFVIAITIVFKNSLSTDTTLTGSGEFKEIETGNFKTRFVSHVVTKHLYVTDILVQEF